MDGEPVDDPERRGDIVPGGQRSFDASPKHLGPVQHLSHFRDRPVRRVGLELSPVRVIADQPRRVGRHIGVEHPAHLVRERRQDLPLLHQRHLLEGLQVGRVDGEQRDERLQVLSHPVVGGRERLEVLSDHRPLLWRLAQQALLHHVGDVFPGDADLREALLDPPHRVRGAGEPGVVEDRLLHAAHEPEPGRLADLADLPQHGKVDAKLVVAPRCEVVEHLVEHEQQALFPVHLLEGLIISSRFLIRVTLVRSGNSKSTPRRLWPSLSSVVMMSRSDIWWPHLRPNHLVPARHRRGRGLHCLRVEEIDQLGVLGECGHHRHEVRLARAVRHDQNALDISRLIEIQIRQDHLGDDLHPVDRDYARSQLPPGGPGRFPGRIHADGPAGPRRGLLHPDPHAAGVLAHPGRPRPQLAEFELRCDTGDYDTAAAVLADIDLDYLRAWGHSRTLVGFAWAHPRANHRPARNAVHLNSLGRCHHRLGDYRQAIDLHTPALCGRRGGRCTLGLVGLQGHINQISIMIDEGPLHGLGARLASAGIIRGDVVTPNFQLADCHRSTRSRYCGRGCK